MLRGVRRAARRGVELLVMQECALTGYAGVDRTGCEDLDWSEVERAEDRLAVAAREHGLSLAYGTAVRSAGGGRPGNAMRLVDARGRRRLTYCKRAMYGDDRRHYAPGSGPGRACMVCGFRVGLRVCFEFRFPEYFRELLARRVEIALVGFSMVGPDARKLPVARAHLQSRAAENGMWVVGANSLSGVQNAPTCIVTPEGGVAAAAPPGRETLIRHRAVAEAGGPLRRSIVGHARSLLRAPRGR